MTTYNQILERCKQESDNVNSAFVSDAEWAHYIGGSYVELYALVVQAFGNDYFVEQDDFTTDGVSQAYDLPADFFKLLGVDLKVTATRYVTLKPFVFAERNNFFGSSSIAMAGQVVRLFYAPLPPAFDSGEDLPDALTIWAEYIVIDAAMKAMAKEESDVSVLMARKQAITSRINSEAENRDAGSPTRIGDVYEARSQGMRYSLKGSQIWLYGSTPPTPYEIGGYW